MVNAQTWINQKYPNKEKLEEIKLEERATIVGQLQIEDFPNLKKISVPGTWDSWGQLTRLAVKNCPNLIELDCSYNEIAEITIANCSNLRKFDCSFNNQWEELAKFNGSKLDYSIVSYIGSLDSELDEQLRAGLPGKKHEDIGRLCFGCLAEGGHGNNSLYRYHAELELTKGGTIEYGVATNENKRETCEVLEGGGLLVVDISSANDGIIKIKHRQVKNKEIINISAGSEKKEEERYLPNDDILKIKNSEIRKLNFQIESLKEQVRKEGGDFLVNAEVEVELSEKKEQKEKLNSEIENFRSETEKLAETIQKLEDKLKQTSDEQWKKQLQEGKADLEKKLVEVQRKLESSEKKQKQLVEEMEGFRTKFIDRCQSISKEIKDCEEELRTKKNNYLNGLNKIEEDNIMSFGISKIKEVFRGNSSHDKSIERIGKILEAQKEITKFGSSSASERKDKKLKKMEKFAGELNELCEIQEKITKLEVELESAKKSASLFNVSQDEIATAEVDYSVNISGNQLNLEHAVEVPPKQSN
jgi:predicted  nucleic acid-binding Zn-ribbon protein